MLTVSVSWFRSGKLYAVDFGWRQFAHENNAYAQSDYETAASAELDKRFIFEI